MRAKSSKQRCPALCILENQVDPLNLKSFGFHLAFFLF